MLVSQGVLIFVNLAAHTHLYIFGITRESGGQDTSTFLLSQNIIILKIVYDLKERSKNILSLPWNTPNDTEREKKEVSLSYRPLILTPSIIASPCSPTIIQIIHCWRPLHAYCVLYLLLCNSPDCTSFWSRDS